MDIAQPAYLLLLPLALLPLLLRRRARLDYPGLELLPADRFSDAIAWGLRVLAALCIALLVIGVSGPHLPAYTVERIGQGAQMVLLLDRSRSMDQSFAQQPLQPLGAAVRGETKGSVARSLLKAFAARRRSDYFAMLAFSGRALPTLPFTNKPALVQAAINAGSIGKALSETDIGRGLSAALRLFEGRPYDGSRIILLISDGGAILNADTQRELRRLLRHYRVTLYWIYLRSRNSPGLEGAEADDGRNDETAPERALHRFFSSLETPYRAYMADNPQALEEAVAAVDRLQLLPIRYQETVPRRDLQSTVFGVALVLLLPLVLVQYGEVVQWRGRR